MAICRAFLVLSLASLVALPSFGATVTRLVGFTSSTGGHPVTPLMQASDGNFYGTTTTGGDDGAGCVHTCNGTVFKLTPAGQLTVLYTFAYDTASGLYVNGSDPQGGLVEGPDGWLYGTTLEGGAGLSYGTVFRISKAGQFVKLHDFCGAAGPCPDGVNPWGELALGRDGWLYGTTSAPLAHPRIYRISLGGNYEALADLSTVSLSYSRRGLVLGSDGNFYGISGNAIYRYAPGGGLTVLHVFSGSDGTGGLGPPIQATDGYLYGVTFEGGAHGYGTVFKIHLDGTGFLKVFDVTSTVQGGGGNEPIMQSSDGNLWASTQSTANGSAYEITTAGTYLQNAVFTTDTGKTPYDQLIEASDGKLYGTTTDLGPSGLGAVYVVDASLPPPAPSEAAASVPMIVTAFDRVGGAITVSYGKSCYAPDHHIVYGPLSGVSTYAYSGQACGLGATGVATFNPGVGDAFFLLVGNTLTREGSYGTGVGGAQRPEATGLAGCDYPQDLSGGCP
ncbi:MAG TPA: choice-of-anchor tandem repeat GloVer-containing protein [Candidatus Polarisedimenticolaceae bacterium]|nr:choice-of-anchor tandem repeat GloVer-containing protein [Candidatus Polarisedimenticolaceae bacterium]